MDLSQCLVLILNICISFLWGELEPSERETRPVDLKPGRPE